MTAFLVIYKGKLTTTFSLIAHQGDKPRDAAQYVYDNMISNQAHVGDVMYVVPDDQVREFRVKGALALEPKN